MPEESANTPPGSVTSGDGKNLRSNLSSTARLDFARANTIPAEELHLHFLAIVESSDDAILSKDLNGIIRSWNKAAERIFGYAAAEIIGRPILTLIPEGHQDEETEILSRVRRGERVDHYQTVRRHKDGSLIDISLTVSPIKDSTGKVIGASKIARDITAQKQAEELQLYFAAIVESSDDAILSKDLNGIIRSWNKAAERIFGYAAAEIVGRPVLTLIPEGYKNEEPDILSRIRRGQRIDHYETVRQRKDGTLVNISLTVSPIKDSTGRVIGASKIARDITARKENERALLEAENQLRQMTNALPQTVWGARPDGQLDYINERGNEYMGEIVRKDGEIDWLSVVHPDDHAHSVRVWKKSLETGQPYQVEQRIFEKKSKTYRWNLSRAMPIRDQQGKIVRWFGTNTDISEFKEIQHALWGAQETMARQNQILEQTVQERTLELRETIRELEAFSFSISHDMRSPLRAMQGYSEALLADYRDKLDATGLHYLERIHKGATRLDLLIRDVLAYSKVAKENVQLVPLNAAATIRDILQTYPNFDESLIKVTLSEIPQVLAHEGLFTQIVSNFLGNAQKFVKPGHFPEIHISAEKLDSQVRIWFRDQGLGIDRRHHEQIFQIFGRVYPEKQYEGTGIGLAIAKKAAERMDGSVGIVSELGQGSHFWLDLKRVE